MSSSRISKPTIDPDLFRSFWTKPFSWLIKNATVVPSDGDYAGSGVTKVAGFGQMAVGCPNVVWGEWEDNDDDDDDEEVYKLYIYGYMVYIRYIWCVYIYGYMDIYIYIYGVHMVCIWCIYGIYMVI